MNAPLEPAPGDDLLGFRLTHRLGEGRTFRVLRGVGHADPSAVRALKVMRPALAARPELVAAMVAEAGAASAVVHPNVARTYGASVDRGTMAVEVELVDGRSLAAIAATSPRGVDALACHAWMRGAAHGLAAVHAAGLVHQGLRPSKLVVVPGDAVKVMDLGTARALSGGPPPPAGDDVYALGVVFFEMLAGAGAPRTTDAGGGLRASADRPDVPRSLDDAIARATARDPAARFASAHELARALEQGATWTAAAPAPAARGKLSAGAVVGIVVAIGAIVLATMGTLGAVAYRAAKVAREGMARAAANVDEELDAPIPITHRDPTWGDRAAPVTIVQFSDFQCPFCARVEPTLDRVRSTYGATDVRIVWKHEPLAFHERARPAAEAGAGVLALGGSPAFWTFHGLAFENQGALSAENLETWGATAGVDRQKLRAGLAAHAWAEKVDEDHALAKRVGVSGTPTFFVNGVQVGGAQPFDKFKEVIDRELVKARAKVASGTAPDRVYVVLSQENRRDAPKAPEAAAATDTKVYRVPVGDSPTRGSPEAFVTIVEYGDFECPYTKRVEDTLTRILTDYGPKGGNAVRLVWKNHPLPFHARGGPAAELALEARAQGGDARFWEAHDQLLGASPKLADADLDDVARAVRLDAGKARSAIASRRFAAALAGDEKRATELGVSGTPQFFVNGRRLLGAQPYETFKKVIDEEIDKARSLVARGVARRDVYVALTRDGAPRATPP